MSNSNKSYETNNDDRKVSENVGGGATLTTTITHSLSHLSLVTTQLLQLHS